MQHGMHNMIDMLKYENELRDRKLKYHHLVADERVRHPRTGFIANLAEQFLPDHLQYLKSFLRKKPMNLLFPVSVTGGTIVAALLIRHAVAAEAGSFDATAFTFVGALLVLAVIEHWFLVLPIADAALWSWGLRSRGAARPTNVTVVGRGVMPAALARQVDTTIVRNAPSERHALDEVMPAWRRPGAQPILSASGRQP